MASVTAKLGNMRKAQSFSIYAPDTDGHVMVQSERSIGRFDPATGNGVLNIKGCYSPHLSKQLGAQDYTFPAEFVAEVLKVGPKRGDVESLANGAMQVQW